MSSADIDTVAIIKRIYDELDRLPELLRRAKPEDSTNVFYECHQRLMNLCIQGRIKFSDCIEHLERIWDDFLHTQQ